FVDTALLSREDGSSAIEVSIKDTGIGIDPDQLDLIFEKFYQIGEVALHSSGKTTFKGGGPGLGLAIVKGIVHAHNGEVWAESSGHNEEAMPGSRFVVCLPTEM
ncbi:MAG: ATP-binding protein, partial [Chloroflexota bacterium]